MFYSFDGFYKFIRGILIGSKVGSVGSDLLMCYDSQTTIINGLNATYNAIASNLTIYGVLLGIDKGLGVLY